MVETILTVDDSPFEANVISRLLKDYDVHVVTCGDEMWNFLKSEIPSIILLDVVLPGEDGFAIAERLSGIEQYRDIPIIFITAKDAGRDVERGFESGGVDYIKKPYNEIELRARIRSALAKKRQEIELREKTLTDPLTGLYNRRYFFEVLAKNIEHARRNPQYCFSVAMIDIDHFKTVNDTLGHQAGDFVLKEVADFLKKSIRPYDLLARYGGEEFIILFKDCTRQEAGEILQRIKDAVESRRSRWGERNIAVTFSSGIADSTEVSPESSAAEDLIRITDRRLYCAKEEGRNRIVIDATA